MLRVRTELPKVVFRICVGCTSNAQLPLLLGGSQKLAHFVNGTLTLGVGTIPIIGHEQPFTRHIRNVLVHYQQHHSIQIQRLDLTVQQTSCTCLIGVYNVLYIIRYIYQQLSSFVIFKHTFECLLNKQTIVELLQNGL